jgi:hypothetical protein
MKVLLSARRTFVRIINNGGEMAFFKNLAKRANFYEPAASVLSEMTGIDKKICHLYFADYRDLFEAVIAKGVGPAEGVPLVANYIAIKILEGTPHSNTATNKYDVGIPRKYDPLALSYFILKLDGSDYNETINRIEEVLP